jgi:hypothetical protein
MTNPYLSRSLTILMKRLSPVLVIFLILLPALITDITRVRSWNTNINADGYGYYAYLPCAFIYHKLDYQKVMDAEHALRPAMDGAEVAYPFVLYNNSKLTDKYFVGEAIVLAPFFMLAYALSYVCGFDLNGYSILFQESVVLAALFYLFLGLLFLRKLMLKFNIADAVIYFTLVLIVYATNLFYYTTTEPSMSHVYSFGLMAVFLYYAKRAIEDSHVKNLLPAALLLGLLAIIRPTNLLIVFAIPFLTDGFQQAKQFLGNLISFKKIALMFSAAFMVVCIQLIKWHAETGHWLIWGYGGEGFDFSKPHFFDVLFSYRKGWFVYTPVMLVALAGAAIMLYIKKYFFRLVVAGLFFLLSTYVLSSWWQWWYGGSFGMRVFIDFYPFYALLFAFALMEMKSRFTKRVMVGVSVLCLALCIIQTIQYNKFIISYDKMNGKRYWDVFLKTADKYGWVYDDPASKITQFDKPMYANNFEGTQYASIVSTAHLHSGSHSLQVNTSSGRVFLCSFSPSDMPANTGIVMYTSLWTYTDDISNNARIITQIKPANGTVNYTDEHNLSDELACDGEWEKIRYISKPLPVLLPTDSVKVFIECSKGSLSVDDIELRFGKERVH